MKLIHTLHTSPDVVFTYLTDMNLFASVHPVISKIESKGNGRYVVHETLKAGPIPFSFTYPVEIYHDSDNSFVVMKATIFKMTKVEMSFTLSAENGITTIEETIHVKSMPPLNRMTLAIIRTQHILLFKHIEIAVHLSNFHKKAFEKVTTS